MRTLVIIPAHNESRTITAVVKAVRLLGHEAVVIDDGSADATGELAKSAGAQMIATGRKSGKGNALRLGFAYALEHGYQGVVTLDGDGQHDPDDISSLLKVQSATGAAVVNGNRMGNAQGMPPVRWLTNKFMSRVISSLCHQHVPDTQCGFRFIAADVLKKVSLECNDFEIETELLIKASRQGFAVASAPVKTIYSGEKSKIHPVADTLRFIRFISRSMGTR